MDENYLLHSFCRIQTTRDSSVGLGGDVKIYNNYTLALISALNVVHKFGGTLKWIANWWDTKGRRSVIDLI